MKKLYIILFLIFSLHAEENDSLDEVDDCFGQDSFTEILDTACTCYKIGKVDFRGNCWFESRRLQAALDIHTDDELTQDEIFERVIWLNKNPFHNTQAIFSINDSILNVEFVTKDRFPVRLYFGSDNTGIKTTDQIRLFWGLNWGNALGLDDLLNYQYTHSPDFRNLQAHTAKYDGFLSWKHQLTFFGGYTTIHPDISGIPTNGQNSQTSFRYIIPLKPLSSSLKQEFAFGYDWKYLNSPLLFFGGAIDQLPPISKTIVNVDQFFFGYSLEKFFQNLWLSYKIEVLVSPFKWYPYQSNQEYSRLRNGAKSRYIYTRVKLNQLYFLPYGFELLTFIRGQASSNTLVFSEEYGLGGYDTVRGFRENAFLADNAVNVNVELHFPRFFIFPGISNTFTFLTFFDYGFGHNYTPFLNEDHTQNLISAGIGVRYVIGSNVKLRADYGFKLNKDSFFKDNLGRFSLGGALSF